MAAEVSFIHAEPIITVDIASTGCGVEYRQGAERTWRVKQGLSRRCRSGSASLA